MRNSIANAADKRNTNGMTVVADITQYMEQRYMRSPSLLNSSLLDIRERKAPRSYQEAADNISATIAIGRILASLEIQESLEITHLAMLESRCIMSGTRRELYNQKQIDNLQANTTGAGQITCQEQATTCQEQVRNRPGTGQEQTRNMFPTCIS